MNSHLLGGPTSACAIALDDSLVQACMLISSKSGAAHEGPEPSSCSPNR
jgi:hypothetical protein